MEKKSVSVQRVYEDAIDNLVVVEKLAWSAPGENVEASREKLLRRAEKDSGQVVILATVDGQAAGSQYAFRFQWDGNVEGLGSWDEHTAEGWTNKVHDDLGETGFLVGVGVIPQFRREKFSHNLRWHGAYKISELLIGKTLDELFFVHQVERVIANARVPWYHKRPDLSIEEYCSFRMEDGRLFDPVLRFHTRMGARIIKPVAFSFEDEESLNAGCWVLYEKPFAG